MRGRLSIAVLLLALLLGGGQALAFQEMPAPPPEDAADATPKPKPQQDPMRLGTPGNAEAAPQADAGGLKLFGYTVMPKLNFGLDVLYGQDEQQLQFKGPSTVEENGDVSVLGKVKRRF
jgi:hypothetical protein